MSSLPHYAQPQRQLQSRSKMQQFRVQIRDRQLNNFKNSIRQEMLRCNTIEDLLQQVPTDAPNANYWAVDLYNAYSNTRRYSLRIEHIIDIFKLVERFPNRCTLLLFEVVIARATQENADMLFQYDVMRVLHGFINFTGKEQLIRCPSSAFSFEESRIISEVVISSAVEAIQRNSAEAHCYSSRLELARISLRIIAELCRKAVHVRNFAIISHKTYTYCLKAHKCFEKDIDNQFYNFLQAATHIAFDRWEDQFTRITSKILHLFYRVKMNVRIELLAEKDDRSYLLAYESLVQAMRNLFNMQNEWVRVQFYGVENSESTVTLGMIVDIVAQCNYVMEFPAAQEQNQNLMPIKLMQATLDLAMRAIETLAKPLPQMLQHPLYQQYARQLVRFLRNREIGFSYGSFVIARRMAVFQLDQFIFQIRNDEGKISSFIAFNPQHPQDNLITLIAYLLQSDTDIDNKLELCLLMKNIIYLFPPCTFEPFIGPSELFRIMLDRLVLIETWCGDELQSAEQALKLNILHVLLNFLTITAPLIGDRVHYYTSLLSQYTQRIHYLMLHQSQRLLERFAKELLLILGESESEL